MAEKEKKSFTEKAAELSKKLDKLGIVGGLAMIAYGVIISAGWAVSGGALLAGTSAATYAVGEGIRRNAERRRKKQASQVIYKRGRA